MFGNNYTMTLTWSECVENHVGMQKIGKLSENGFSKDDMAAMANWCKDHNIDCKIYNMGELLGSNVENAYFLLAKNFIGSIFEDNGIALYNEQLSLKKDTKALMRGRVVNKKARYNLCFADEPQNADFECGKGTVYSFSQCKNLSLLRDAFGTILGESGRNLYAEGNYYYDTDKCYIGYHGDVERKKIIGVRLGDEFPLWFKWYQNSNPVSQAKSFDLQHGDLYMMMEKTAGNDWRKKKIPTLRHAAGLLENIQ